MHVWNAEPAHATVLQRRSRLSQAWAVPPVLFMGHSEAQNQPAIPAVDQTNLVVIKDCEFGINEEVYLTNGGCYEPV